MESLCISGASFASSVPGRQLRHSLLQRNLIHVRHCIKRLKAVETELYPIEPLIDDVKYQDGMFSVSGRIYSEVPSYDIYSTLTDYDSLPRVFHNVDHCSVRISEDGRKFIHQMVLWNFLIFRGSFETALQVSEDSQNLKLSFSLLESAFMKQFIGTWSVEEDPGTGISMSGTLSV
eukprot:jgi/Picre1/27841/NNA_000805.t1